MDIKKVGLPAVVAASVTLASGIGIWWWNGAAGGLAGSVAFDAVFHGDSWEVSDGRRTLGLDLEVALPGPVTGMPVESIPTGGWCGGWSEEMEDERHLRRDHVWLFDSSGLKGVLLDSVGESDFGYTQHAGDAWVEEGLLCVRGTDREPIDSSRSSMSRQDWQLMESKVWLHRDPFPLDGERACWSTTASEQELQVDFDGIRSNYTRCAL